MVQDPKFIKQFIEELPADDREDLKRIFTLIESYAEPLTIDDVREVARITSHSPIRAYQQYEEYSREQQLVGQLLVCNNLTCLGKGAGLIIQELEQKSEYLSTLGVNLEYVKCLGGCSVGPCIFYDGKMYSNIDSERLNEFLDNLG